MPANRRVDRSKDRHTTGNQVGIAARLDRADYDEFETAWRTARIPNRRQAIIAAIRNVTRKWLDESDTTTQPEGEPK